MDTTLPSIVSRLFVEQNQRNIAKPHQSSTTSSGIMLPDPARSSSSRRADERIPLRSNLPPPSFVDVQETPSPPRKIISNCDKAKIEARPVTPLDFGNSSKDKTMPSNGKQIRTSIDQKLAVEPAIKGIPQGRQEDLAISVTNNSTSISVVSQNVATIPHRNGAFKDTRIKLSSLSGTMRSSFRDRSNDKDEKEKRSSSLKLHKGSVRSNQRGSKIISSSLKMGLQSDHRPVSPNHRSNHGATHSAYSDTSFNTANTEASLPLVPPSAPTESTECSTAEFSLLFTPTSQMEYDYPASITSSRSTQSRERVLGLISDPSPVSPAGMESFTNPAIEEVLPFAGGQPFAAWSSPVDNEGQISVHNHNVEVGRRGSMSPGRLAMLSPKDAPHTESSMSFEGWEEIPRPRSNLPGKKVWLGSRGDQSTGVYDVGAQEEDREVEVWAWVATKK
ncbi:uncharacterized protein I206_103365 [Kwoniella pini CBS 10737]|uniref:Uncharacterized protein n=1 Tax=Kwoniella pini CBS 10737 TaxID=1296096 RepID=A0A1B9IA98_9TREE|nr:uncharacterized protein I206_01630 [Kwoniella pini CBS 10737]OCF52341.1 hypothetical protein I206_01630 [Kwoniella pini CBS 10737]